MQSAGVVPKILCAVLRVVQELPQAISCLLAQDDAVCQNHSSEVEGATVLGDMPQRHPDLVNEFCHALTDDHTYYRCAEQISVTCMVSQDTLLPPCGKPPPIAHLCWQVRGCAFQKGPSLPNLPKYINPASILQCSCREAGGVLMQQRLPTFFFLPCLSNRSVNYPPACLRCSLQTYPPVPCLCSNLLASLCDDEDESND
eukprot:scaffold152161_cov16-Tisochrysis_lutea.AAC.3